MFSFVRLHIFMPRVNQSFCYRICKNHYAKYVQGQSPESRVREYFYYIDHQGMLFLDDARMKNFTSCFKDKKFLAFFFNRLKINNTGRYTKDFPYISLCGSERNFIRCDDFPIVFTKIIQKQNCKSNKIEDWFSYGHAEELLMVPFQPDKLYMNIESGRVYHPAPEKAGGIGLVRSKIAIELSSNFKFEKGEDHSPTHIAWRDRIIAMDMNWFKDQIQHSIKEK